MKLNWKALIALLAVLSLVAAACGDDGDTETETDNTETGAASDSLMDGEIKCEQQYEGETVSIFSPVRNSANDEDAIAEMVAGYDPLAECTGVEIDWQGTDQFETEINVRLEGGDPPDVIDYPQPGLMASHVAQELPVDCPADVAAHLATTSSPAGTSTRTVDGTIYGLPGRSNIKSLVWYSPGASPTAGYEIPTPSRICTALSDQIVPTAAPRGASAPSPVSPPAGSSPTGWRTSCSASTVRTSTTSGSTTRSRSTIRRSSSRRRRRCLRQERRLPRR